MKIKVKIFIIMIFISMLSCSSNKENYNPNDYEIISAILNYSFGSETDLENGLFWIDDSREYDSLLILNHTTLRDFDLEIINNYFKSVDSLDFSIIEFKNKKQWDIEKIQNYERYKLISFEHQEVKSPYIGMLHISSIVYNQKFDRALVYISFLCAGNGDCGKSSIYYLKKDDKWRVEDIVELLVT